MSKAVKCASELATTDIAQYLFENLHSVLLKKECSWKDREYDERWLSWENFGEYYAANKFLFAPATYTDPNRRIIRIAEVFILHQLGGLLNRSPEGRDYETYRDAIRQALEQNIDTAVAMMDARWPKEMADIVRNNENRLLG
jgi:hypothetical protein